MDTPPKAQKRVINIFVLAMFNVSIMASLRNLPLVAEFGYSSIFFFAVVGVLFLIPCALVSAELATGWPKSGGIYVWVREAFGDTWGFFAIWMQWVHNVTWYPAILSFVATTIAYITNPALADNHYFVLAVIIFGFWGMTLINFMGIRTSSLFSTVGVIGGTLIPGIFIIALGFSWFISGNPVNISFSAQALIPDLSSVDNIVFMTGLFLAFAGLEVSAAYAGEVKNPQKNYPRSIILAATITFFLFLLGSLSIAFIIPKEEISLVSGLMEAFKMFLENYHIKGVLSLLGVLLIFGAVAEVNSWIMGPVKALYTTSIHGNLPPIFQRLNKHGMPTNLLLFQAIIVTLVSAVFLFLPTLSGSYWILSAMSAQLYLVMYILMFISAIKLRYSRPNVPRAYRIPHPHKGMWIAATIGGLTSLFGIFVGFFPPASLNVGNIYVYEGFLVSVLVVMIAIPLVLHAYRSPDWMPDLVKERKKLR